MATSDVKEPTSEIAALMVAVRTLLEVAVADRSFVAGRDEFGHVLTPREAADLLRVSEEAVRRAAVLNELPGQLIDGDWRFVKNAVYGWLASGRRETGPRGGLYDNGRFPPKTHSAGPIQWSEETAKEADEFLARLEKLR